MESKAIRHFFTTFTTVKCYESSFSDYRVFTCVRTDGQTDRHDDVNKYITEMRKKIKRVWDKTGLYAVSTADIFSVLQGTLWLLVRCEGLVFPVLIMN
jgi:hypothetical protein